GEAAEDQRNRDHVLDAVVAVGIVGERAGLVDDAYARFLGFDHDLFDAVELAGHFRVQPHRAFDRGLGVELGRIADLEQHVLHDVAAERALELERLAAERDILEAPGPRAERGRITDYLPIDRVDRVGHRAAARIAGRPALA